MGLRVTMLGTGAALPDPDRNHSSIVVSVRGRNYLFDCGHGATHQMVRANIDPSTVNVIFLSHLHFDHIADFAFFMISTWMANRQDVPVVVGPPDTRHFVDSLLVNGAYRKDIEARVQYPQRRKNLAVLTPDVRECAPGLVYEDDLVKVQACYVEHIPREISPCFGLRVDTIDGESVVFSGDTAPCDRLVEMARGADLKIMTDSVEVAQAIASAADQYGMHYQLLLEVELKRIRRGIGQFTGYAKVNDRVVANAELMCAKRSIDV